MSIQITLLICVLMCYAVGVFIKSVIGKRILVLPTLPSKISHLCKTLTMSSYEKDINLFKVYFILTFIDKTQLTCILLHDFSTLYVIRVP